MDAAVSDPRLCRFYGAAIGCAVGDALGAPLEGIARDDILGTFGPVDRFIDISMLSFFRRDPELLVRKWRLPGAHTDDTQQFLALLDCYTRCRSTAPGVIADAFVKLFPYSRGHGRGFRKFCTGILKKEAAWRDARLPDNAGAGSAMRAGAAALIFPDSPDSMRDAAVTQSCVTHTDVRAHLAALLVASSVFDAISSRSCALDTLPQVRDWHARTVDSLRNSVPVVRSICLREGVPVGDSQERTEQFLASLDQITRFLDRMSDLNEARNAHAELTHRIAEAADRDRHHKHRPTGTLNFALEAPVAAYATFLLFGETFPDAVTRGILLGGDTDTVGAMVGQMSGALLGFDPSWWVLEGETTLKPADQRAERSVRPEWFQGLVARYEILHGVDRLLSRPLTHATSAFPPEPSLEAGKDFLSWERHIGEMESQGRARLVRQCQGPNQ